MQLAVINRNNHSLHTCLYKYDAFGNALGNSVVRAAQSGGSAAGGGDKSARNSAPIDPDTGKFSPGGGFDLDAHIQGIKEQRAIDASAFDLTPSNDDISRFFQSSQTRDFLQARADEQLVIENFAASLGNDPFGFARTSVGSGLSNVDLSSSTYSTIDNPYGLLPNQLAKANFLANNPLSSLLGGGPGVGDLSYYERQQYDFASSQFAASLSGPQLQARDLNFEAAQRNQKLGAQEFFFGRQTPETRIAQGITDVALLSRGGRLTFTTIAGIGLANTDTASDIAGLVSDGGDLRFALGFKQGQSEGKIFGGTDIFGASGKGPLFTQFIKNRNDVPILKTDFSSRVSFNTADVLNFDFSNPTFDIVREIDANKIPFNIPGKRPIGGDVTVGIRQSSNPISQPRASINVKFELPPALQRFTFGATPTFTIEGRGN
jgi:hypothetical protein